MRRLCIAVALSFAVMAFTPAASALTVERISATVRRHVGEVRACYVHASTLRPELRGRLVVRFTVAAAGTVSDVQVQTDSVGDPSMRECVLGVVRGWQFPVGAAPETVTYPFEFAR